MAGCYSVAQTAKITLSNLVIKGKLQINPVEAKITFIIIPAQAGCLTGAWEDAEESFPEEIEITFVENLEALTLVDEEGFQYHVSKNNNILKMLTDEQIEDIIRATSNLKKGVKVKIKSSEVLKLALQGVIDGTYKFACGAINGVEFDLRQMHNENIQHKADKIFAQFRPKHMRDEFQVYGEWWPVGSSLRIDTLNKAIEFARSKGD
jgi:hypothetical protein